ncbi:hypothetical protein Poli38472_006732 [Pythium oligandrum]|uniref:C2 domain-containing protein n=1 Tax=Pythium oligandrum TaxID=41045 RepID=A0A8K1C564_PYTOL|nr:hypothetical protein Poli38472_006732 [Pythium oligandrum]|eukprot:TMW56722.1 hypothetical protein Poli38472_006732 [Pythium oligandrum]
MAPKTSSVSAPDALRLRVQADGAQGISAGGGFLSLDKRPDPFVTFVLDGVTHKCAAVDNVEPLKYFAWPNAVHEFEIKDEEMMKHATLVLHVRDSDLLKNRYIGGTSIALGPLYAARQGKALCQGQLFMLEYADEKFKKKKASGEVKMTIMLVQDEVSTPQAPPESKNEPKPTPVEPIAKPPAASEATSNDKEAAHDTKTSPAPLVETEKPSQMPVMPVTAPIESADKKASTESPAQVETVVTLPSSTSDFVVEEKTATQTAESTEPTGNPSVTVKTIRIELVSARNLTRPTSLGAFLDRKPDPVVTMEFHGISKASPVLNNVDLKKPIEWNNVSLLFELPVTPPKAATKTVAPLNLVTHVKDDNVLKDTYMGGGKLSLAEFFLERSEPSWLWLPSPAAVNGIERVITLQYADHKFSKKKACGEITVRFHFEMTPQPPSASEDTSPEKTVSIPESAPIPIPEDVPVKETQQEEQPKPVEPVEVTPSPPAPLPSADVKMLSIEMLSGQNVHRPSTGDVKKLLKSLFDRKPDPYAQLVLGNQSKKCPGVNDVDIAFFQWKNAVQVFEFAEKPYPQDLFIHIRDEDVAGSDPYMGGARFDMKEIWDEAQKCALSNPPGDPQAVRTVPLTFLDEKMMKQGACGQVTVRFRWIYSDTDLPVSTKPLKTDAPPIATASDEPPPPRVDEARCGYLYLRKMAVLNSVDIIDASHDLFLEVSSASTSSIKGQSVRFDPVTSNVLTDAFKGNAKDPTSRAEWHGEELVIPICSPISNTSPEVLVILKDKNAIMKDADIASKLFQVGEHAEQHGEQPVVCTLELEVPKSRRKKAALSVKIEVEIQFLPLGASALAATTSGGGIFTIFLAQSLFSFAPNAKVNTSGPFSVHIEPLAMQKKSLLSFGSKPKPEFQTDDTIAEKNMISGWWRCFCLPLSSKQVQAAKEKETLDVVFQVHTAGIHGKMIGSLQLNLFTAFDSSTKMRSVSIVMGSLGSVELGLAASFRNADLQSHHTSDSTVAHVPSGNLHILVLQARNLVSPDANLEKAEDLDPEVRLAIEPKYIKRKENPVRSMLKTKPLENAGLLPTWNEYLRLEYRLPPPITPMQALTAGKPADQPVETETPTFPPPIVQVGVYDIQIPGERNGSKPIGKAELPLSAFVVSPHLDGSQPLAGPTALTITLRLNEKKTGILVVEGIFEPLVADPVEPRDEASEAYRLHCRAAGRSLRDKGRQLKSGEPNATDISQKTTLSGRLDIHVIGARSKTSAPLKDGLAAHFWIGQDVEDRKEVKSRMHLSENTECQIEWDVQLTLYTSDIGSDLLRVEVLSDAGTGVGSLKLPLIGLQRLKRGQVSKEWHQLITSAPFGTKQSTSSSSELLLAIAFHPDEPIANPLLIDDGQTSSTNESIVVSCRQLIPIALPDAKTVKESVEIACKCVLVGGGSTSDAPATTAFRSSSPQAEGIVMWGEQIKLDLGCTASSFIRSSFKLGMTPILRIDVLTRRQSARFNELWASKSLALFEVLRASANKNQRWCRLYSTENELVALLDIEFLSVPAAIPASDLQNRLASSPIAAVPGVLCVRFISGRNLTDVDPNGEQDPYVVGQILPRSHRATTKFTCQTAISLNGGRHPQWNSVVYELHTIDLLTDYLRLEVMDSNEEDHLPDAYIGAIDLALATLFHKERRENPGPLKKTRWLEAWVPIYPIAQGAAIKSEDEESTGEIRLEYRFLSQAYYEAAKATQDLSITSPFSVEDAVEIAPVNVPGTLTVHIVRAKKLPCSKGMQPGVRISCPAMGYSHITPSGKDSIVDPSWTNEILHIQWTGNVKEGSVVSISIEIVDLAVRTANANALAVLTFGTADLTPFLLHPMAKSYREYTLGGRSATNGAIDAPTVLLGCQFVPKGSENQAQSLQLSSEVVKHCKGNIHVKVTRVRFDLPVYLDLQLMRKSFSVRLRCELETRVLEFPAIALSDLVESDGLIEWKVPTDEEESARQLKDAVLFPFVPLAPTPDGIEPNPALLGEIFIQAGGTLQVIATFEVPVFDFILLNGHLSSSWYNLHSQTQLPSGNQQSEGDIGKARLEVQFLPVLVSAKDKKTEISDAQLLVFGVEVKEAKDIAVLEPCIVVIEMMGCRNETKPNVLGDKALGVMQWSETLEFPGSLAKLQSMTSYPIKVDIRSAANHDLVIAQCTWILPQELASATNADESISLDDHVVQLETSALPTQTGKNSKKPVVLTLRLSRHLHGKAGALESTESIESYDRKGLLYVSIAPPSETGSSAVYTAAFSGDNLCVDQKVTKEGTLQPNVPWVDLTSAERRVVPVTRQFAPEKDALVVVHRESSDPVSITILGSHELASIVKTPEIEVSHRLHLSPVEKLAKQCLPYDLPCKFIYVDVLDGDLVIRLTSITLLPSWNEKLSTHSKLFQCDVRLLNSMTKWIQSSEGQLDQKTQQITWRDGKNMLEMTYSNEKDVSEPILHLVLSQVAPANAQDDKRTTKVAFAQIPLLTAIVNPQHGEFLAIPVALTSVASATTQEPVKFTIEVAFRRGELSREALDAQKKAEQDERSLKLAEGAAQLKKAFSAMGGDEATPIKIRDLKAYVLGNERNESRSDAREVLLKAAELEMDGDLDRLFAAMDVNGDGQISWDEYVDQMQSIHALADAAHARKEAMEAKATRDEEKEREDKGEKSIVREVNPAKEDKPEVKDSPVEDPESEEELDVYSNIPVEPTRNPSEPVQNPVMDSYVVVASPAGEPSHERKVSTSTVFSRRSSTKTDTIQEKTAASIAAQVVTATDRRKTTLKPENLPTTRPAKSIPLSVASRVSEPTQRDEQPTSTQTQKRRLPILSSYVLDWKVDDVVQWLTYDMELGQYAEAIKKNAVNGKLLLTLTMEELETELGVTAGLHKRKLMNQITEWQDKFEYPPPALPPRAVATQRQAPMKRQMPVVQETPAFIKREQLIYQTKQQVKEVAVPELPRTIGQTRTFPAKTCIVDKTQKSSQSSTEQSASRRQDAGETFDDAMADIFEALSPDSPPKDALPSHDDLDPPLKASLPVIQIGSITNSDELFEIVRQRIQQLSQQLLPLPKQVGDTFSDFGDDDDDENDGDSQEKDEEQTRLRLVFLTFTRGQAQKISRHKFQEGLASLLAIEVSWHQFDLLFRRLDVDGDSELCWDEFRHVFTRRHITFEQEDLLFLQDALVNYVIDRLESQQWTLSDLFKAFDRDGGGAVSIAEFSTLVRFLFTAQDKVQAKTTRKTAMKKRHVYLLMSCLDVSADRRISLQEFLRFFFVVWSTKLMEIQDQLFEIESTSSDQFKLTASQRVEVHDALKADKRKMRRALRTNFSRPFRDAMRCLDATIPSPFTGLLNRLNLLPSETAPPPPSASIKPASTSSETSNLQVWQVLKGETSKSHQSALSFHHLHSKARAESVAASKKRVQKGKNEVLRTKLTRQREPERSDALLRTPSAHVSLDETATLKFDFRPRK